MQLTVKYYYNINRILMSQLGAWPSQSIFMKILLPTIVLAFVSSVGLLEFVRLSETWRHLTEDCECFIIGCVAIGANAKLLIVVLKNKNIEYLLSLIDSHWRIFTHSLEVQVMQEYAIETRKMTITYTVIIYSLMSLFMLLPLTPQILDALIPLNKSRPYIYLFDVDFSFDREENFYLVLVHAYLTIVMAVTTMVVADTTYIMLTHHACSLFAAIGHRLENLTSKIMSKTDNCPVENIICSKNELVNDDNRIYRELVLLLRKHQISLEYVDLLESLFQLYSFIMLFLHVTVMSLLGLQILSLMDHKEQMFRYVSMVLGGFMHLFVLSYPGQEIMDHSTDIFHKAYSMLWYKMSRKSTQLVSILLYRGLVPCMLTAGKLYVLSLENYASVMQGTLSYFTALASFK